MWPFDIDCSIHGMLHLCRDTTQTDPYLTQCKYDGSPNPSPPVQRCFFFLKKSFEHVPCIMRLLHFDFSQQSFNLQNFMILIKIFFFETLKHTTAHTAIHYFFAFCTSTFLTPSSLVHDLQLFCSTGGNFSSMTGGDDLTTSSRVFL